MQRTHWTLLSLAVTAGMAAAASAEPIAHATGGKTLYRLDLATGNAIPSGPIGYRDVEGLALSPEGVLYAVADAGLSYFPGSTLQDVLLRLDSVHGAGSLVGALGLSGQGSPPYFNLDYGLAFTCDGRLWLTSDIDRRLWEVDPESGATRQVAVLPARISGLDGRGRMLYGFGVNGDDGQPVGDQGLWRIDPDRGEAVRLSTLRFEAPVFDAGLAFDSAGRLWATLDYLSPEVGIPPLRNDLVELDPVSGSVLGIRRISGTGEGYDTVQMEGLAISPPGACDEQVGTNDDIRPLSLLGGMLLCLMSLVVGMIGLRDLRRRG